MLRIKFTVDRSRMEHHWFAKHHTKSVPAKIILETEKFKNLVESRWKEKELFVSVALEELTGVKLTGEFIVSVLHPSLEVAEYRDEQNIEWGYDELFSNYIVMGLAHELLHCLTHHFYKSLADGDKWVFHALIYLSLDEELRFKLNGKSDYFSSPIIETYHKKLIQTATIILPHWIEYTTRNKARNIFSAYEEISELNIEM